MKKALILLTIILLAGTASFAQTSQNSTKKHHTTKAGKKYTCTMDADVVKNKPGKCPKCGMDLVLMDKKSKKENKAHKMKM